MRIFTSRFANLGCVKDGVPIGIVLGRPTWPSPAQDRFSDLLAPDADSFRRHRHQRIEFEAAYRVRLKRAGVPAIRAELERLAPGAAAVVLLCYEDLRKDGEFCHRRMFARWWTEVTGEQVWECVEVSRALTPSQRTEKRDARAGQQRLF